MTSFLLLTKHLSEILGRRDIQGQIWCSTQYLGTFLTRPVHKLVVLDVRSDEAHELNGASCNDEEVKQIAIPSVNGGKDVVEQH